MRRDRCALVLSYAACMLQTTHFSQTDQYRHQDSGRSDNVNCTAHVMCIENRLCRIGAAS